VTRRRRTNRIAVSVIATVFLVVIAAGALWGDRLSCSALFDHRDPPALERREALMLADEIKRFRSSSMAVGNRGLRTVGSTTVHGRSADLQLADGVPLRSDFVYVSIWRDVYARAHGGKAVCVRMALRSPRGEVVRQTWSGSPM
jgi:hypothetical protein